jgi:hypothetical protein
MITGPWLCSSSVRLLTGSRCAPAPASRRYGIYILVIECMGISAMLPYASLLVVYTLGSGSRGLPKDDGQTIATKRWARCGWAGRGLEAQRPCQPPLQRYRRTLAPQSRRSQALPSPLCPL